MTVPNSSMRAAHRRDGRQVGVVGLHEDVLGDVAGDAVVGRPGLDDQGVEVGDVGVGAAPESLRHGLQHLQARGRGAAEADADAHRVVGAFQVEVRQGVVEGGRVDRGQDVVLGVLRLSQRRQRVVGLEEQPLGDREAGGRVD